MVSWWLVWGALADAPRFEQPLVVRQGAALVGDGPARLRGSSGPIRAWVFPDGYVEHAVRSEAGRPVERVRFDGHLAHHLTVRYVNGVPASVLVRGVPDQEVPVADWTPTSFGDARLRLPDATVGADVLTARVGGGSLTVREVAYEDVRAEAFARAIEAGAGGVLLGVSTAWIDALPAVRLTLALPDPESPRVAEVWAIPRAERLVLATWVAPEGSAGTSIDVLAPGRAALALLTWEGSP